MDLSQQTPLERKREQVGWYFYDWANSAFASTVLTLFLGPIESVRRAIAEAQVHHTTVDYQEFNGGHEWRGDLAWTFLSKHL